MAGERVSHFELLSEFCRDSTGSVYLARDLSQERSVAVRIVDAAAFPSEQARQRFLQDALAISRIDHPNIASVHDVEEIDGRVLVAFEGVEDGPLSNRIGKLSASESSGILGQILGGLKALHAEGVVHGALCPGHIFVANDGTVKLASFGVGRLAGARAPAEADPRVVACLSPEAIVGEDIDERADLWSLGVLLYEMLTGFAPFDGEDTPSLVFRILNSEPRPVFDERGDIPVELRRLVFRLLRKDPEERPSSVSEVIADLTPSRGRVSPRVGRFPVAVMYFTYAGADRGRAHIATGLAEDIISRLSGTAGLSVTSRHDVLALRNRDVDPVELGKCMGVGAVLKGVVWSLGDRMRVTARLTDTQSGRDLWNERFEGPTGEAFDVSPAIALRVVEALDVEVAQSEKRRITGTSTDDPRAYDFHARGREFLTHRGRKNTEAAIRMFQYAVTSDPTLAVAHESLAAAYSGMFTYYDGADVWLDRMVGSGTRALELDPGLVEARLHLGMVFVHRREYDRARAAFDEIIRMRPDYYEAYRWLGILSDITGKYDEALEFYHKSAEIKPCSVEPWLYVNMTHRRRGDLPAAMIAAKKFLEVGLKTLHIAPDDPVTLSRFCVIYTLFDEKEKAHDALKRILGTGTEDGLVLYNCAATYALLGDTGMSLDCLRRALSGGYKNVREWIESDPDFDEIRKTQGFRDLLSEFDLRHED